MAACPKVTLRSEQVHAEIAANLQHLVSLADNHGTYRALVQRIASTKRLIEEFETLPKSLDPHLQSYVDNITATYLTLKDRHSDEDLVNGVAGLVLSLAKVRGFKFVATFFSTDVYMFTRVLAFLEPQEILKSTEECYFLLLWLSNLVLVPFNLDTVKESLAQVIMETSTRFMFLHTSASKTQVVSASILALLLTRADCGKLLVEYTDTVKCTWTHHTDTVKLGYLMTFNQLLKRASSSQASKFAQDIYYDITLYELSRLIVEESDFSTTNIRYLFKVASKSSRFFIGSARWDTVAEIIDSFSFIMQLMKDRLDTSLRECLAKGLSRMVGYLMAPAENYASQLVRYMLKQIKADMPNHYCSELTFDLQMDLLPLYHTVLLFSGFLAMTKSLQTEFYAVYLSIVHQTAYVSYRSSGLHQSSQLRDASCFCMWALVKNMTAEGYSTLFSANPEAISSLFLDAIRIAIFDEDLTIRRCGVAVLQEFTGRFGSVFFQTLLPNEDKAAIGTFTIKFIELFNTNAIGTLTESHLLIHDLASLGFPKEIFLEQILIEIGQDLCPFQVKIEAGNQISRLFEVKSKPLLILAPELTKKQVILFLEAEVQKSNFGALHALAQLQMTNHLTMESANNLNEIVTSLSFDFHHDDSEKGEAMLNWLVAALETKLTSGCAEVIPLVIDISKLTCSEGLVKVIRKFFSLTEDIPGSDYAEVCRQIRLGNHLLAKSITAHNTSDLEMNQLLELLLDKSVEAKTRAYVISGFLALIPRNHGHTLLQLALINLLDDYSVSSQGDVGLLVRFACLELLMDCPEFAAKIKSRLLGKLIRIAGETLDKLRLAAFKCLCLLEGKEEFQANYHLYNNDYKLYFRDLFHLFSSSSLASNHAESFWCGLMLTAGATVAGSDLINLSMRQIMFFLGNETDLNEFWVVVLRLLSLPSGRTLRTLDAREKKVIHATLNLIAKLFDAQIPFPSTFDYETLFVRSYNLHINTAHTGRISLVIRIFQHLSCTHQVPKDVALKALKRLCWLATMSSLERVRSVAMDALHETVIELEPNHEILDRFEQLDELNCEEKQQLVERAEAMVRCVHSQPEVGNAYNTSS